jgi:hypothetical protein
MNLNDLVKWQSIAVPDIKLRMDIFGIVLFSFGFFLGKYLFESGGVFY